MAECSQIKRLGFRALWLVWKNVWKNAERTEPKLVSGRCLHTRAARGAMTISQLFVLAPNGHTIVHKDYRGDVSKDAPEIFLRKVVDKLDAPIFTVCTASTTSACASERYHVSGHGRTSCECSSNRRFSESAVGCGRDPRELERLRGSVCVECQKYMQIQLPKLVSLGPWENCWGPSFGDP